MHFIEIGEGDRPSVVFAHGWGRSHHDFIPAAESLGATARSMLVDLPGFGQTPRPDVAWDTRQYADYIASFLAEQGIGRVIWVGHSFGGRIGLRLARHHPDLLGGLIVVAGAGMPRQRVYFERVRNDLRRRQFRVLKWLAGADEARRDALEKRFGSPDYVESKRLGLRDIFLATIAEDQSPDLPDITVRTELLYGAKDGETPVEIGQRMAALIPGARLTIFPEYDHFSILNRGHHVIALRAKALLAERAS
ncbi:MAG: alpha/beta hydrolase [Alphaproteobacteria bacterium]|nr:alpha/beta hydrolase [Alphaproteobacteria bacterium]